jgi:uncharacterized small protein (DUF1192 family)
MRILETGMKLNKEAFVEKRFKSGVNILFSNDNNKGKTLVIQGMLYSMGNQPIFPTGFQYRDAVFYVKCEFGTDVWTFLRKDNLFLVHGPKGINTFESVSELKRFYTANIARLPEITKDNEPKIVDPELFFQIFYLSQDKRNPSNLIGGRYYNKVDFIEMIYAFNNQGAPPASKEDLEDAKKQLVTLNTELESLKRRRKFAKKHPDVASMALRTSDKESMDNTRSELSKLNERISNLKKERVREENRKLSLEKLLTELLSLNKELSEGKVRCADCGSVNIIYKVEDFTYDVSNAYVRTQVIESITNQILLKKEIIEERTREINSNQVNLQRILEITPKPIQQFLLFSEEISSLTEIDEKIVATQADISRVSAEIERLKKVDVNKITVKNTIQDDVISLMNSYYRKIDSNGIQTFRSLFTTNDQTYSGSEEQEFYFSKLVALNDVLKHEYPIIIDSFRDGEISSNKEEEMIKILLSKNKQCILTSTLKHQEYIDNKYAKFPAVTAINYSAHDDSHILNPKLLNEFEEVYSLFGISKL